MSGWLVNFHSDHPSLVPYALEFAILVNSDGGEDLKPQAGEIRIRSEPVMFARTKRFSLATVMSINWVELNERKQPIPINDEVIVRSEPNADLVLSFNPPNPPDANRAPSGKGKAKANALEATGTVYVTDERVSWFLLWFLLTIPHSHSYHPSIQLVFVSSAFGQAGSFDTFSVQLLSLLSIQYQQPYFGSNYLALDIKPSPGGGLTEGAKAELRLKDKGLFELSGTLEKSRERALYKKRDEMLNQPQLREYKHLRLCGLN